MMRKRKRKRIDVEVLEMRRKKKKVDVEVLEKRRRLIVESGVMVQKAKLGRKWKVNRTLDGQSRRMEKMMKRKKWMKMKAVVGEQEGQVAKCRQNFLE
jgi:hypothetical protein